MNEDITRVVTVQSSPSAPDGTFSGAHTDAGPKAPQGFSFHLVEKPWADNVANLSDIPRPARYPARYQWSEKHQRSLYHIEVPGRTVIEWHAANVHWQLLGCGAPGDAVAIFKANSLHPGMPPVDCRGVTNSGATLEKFHEAMQDANGKQMPFWLDIS